MDKIPYEGKELLPPKADTVFKALFTKESNRDLLASFIGSVLGMDIKPEEIVISNIEIPPAYEAGKLSRLDVRVNIAGKNQIDIEVQIGAHKSFSQRSIFYLSKLYIGQLSEGQTYKDLIRTIAINILDFKILPFAKYHSCFRLKEIEENLELTDMFEINFLELPKVPMDNISDLKTLWAQYLSAQSEEVLKMLAAKNPVIEKAVGELLYLSADEQARYEYDMRQKAMLDYLSDIQESREEGWKEGKTEGWKEGKTEGQIEIALKLLSRGSSLEDIAEITGLSLRMVQELKSK